jgi:Zn/Cd-binding protein ZinT
MQPNYTQSERIATEKTKKWAKVLSDFDRTIQSIHQELEQPQLDGSMSKKQLAKLLSVSPRTLDAWYKNGFIAII